MDDNTNFWHEKLDVYQRSLHSYRELRLSWPKLLEHATCLIIWNERPKVLLRIL